MRLLVHPETTDLGYVRVMKETSGMWGRISESGGLEEYPRFLPRCRALRRMTLTPLGRGSFRWAVEEKEMYLLGGRGGRGGGDVSGLVPLERVHLLNYGSSTDGADDIAFGFFNTLKVLYISTTTDIQSSPLPQTIEIGRGWINMPVLTDLRMDAYNHRLLIDQMLLLYCLNLTIVRLSDNTRSYPCQDIIPTLPAQLEKVTELKLEGWPALTFHPATLSWATELEVLRIRVHSEAAGRRCFIPPVEELTRSYGDHQDGGGSAIETGVGQEGGRGGGEILPLIIQRPVWSWDWKLRQLTKLEFTGEFAFRFQFRMLSGCPALKELVLNMETEQEGSHVRVLTYTNFFIPDDEPVLDELDPRTQQLRQHGSQR